MHLVNLPTVTIDGKVSKFINASICEEEGELEEAKWYRLKEYDVYEGMNNKGGMIKALEKIEVLCLALKDNVGAERIKNQIKNLYYR